MKVQKAFQQTVERERFLERAAKHSKHGEVNNFKKTSLGESVKWSKVAKNERAFRQLLKHFNRPSKSEYFCEGTAKHKKHFEMNNSI